MDNARVELQGYYFAGPKYSLESIAIDKLPSQALLLISKLEKDYPNAGLNKSSKISPEFSGPAIMLGGAYDIASFGPASIYLTGGAGMSYIKATKKIDIDTGDADLDKLLQEEANKGLAAMMGLNEIKAKARFAFNAGAGVSFSVSDSVDLEAGYLFTNLGKIEELNYNLMSHNINVGVRFSF